MRKSNFQNLPLIIVLFFLWTTTTHATFMRWGSANSWEGLGGWHRQEYPDYRLFSSKTNVTNTFSGLVASTQPLADELNGKKYFSLPFSGTATMAGRCIEITTIDKERMASTTFDGSGIPDDPDLVIYAKNTSISNGQYERISDDYVGFYGTFARRAPSIRLWLIGANKSGPKVTIYVVPYHISDNNLKFEINMYGLPITTEAECGQGTPARPANHVDPENFDGFIAMPPQDFLILRGKTMIH